MIETLDRLDGELLLWLNSMHSAYFDHFMWLATGRWIWIPLYIAILLVLLRSQGWRRTLVWLIAVAVTITLADQICATWLRPEFARYRPANLLNPISGDIHIVNDYRGGRYGFPSCHGANSFALFALLTPVVKRRAFTLTLLLWALLNCYTRIYLGVHYPGDILTGAAIGACCGLLVYAASTAILRHYAIKPTPYAPIERPVRMPDEYIAVTAGTLLLIIMALVAAWQTIQA